MATTNQELIERVTTTYNEAAHKLDYFILGVTLAICAYLAQTNPYARLGFNQETFLLISLIIFAASATCGFARIEIAISSIRLNLSLLNQPDPEKRKKLIQEFLENKGPLYAKLRNYLLLAGLACYVATKVWAKY